jgi:hypothetical protein
MPEIAPEFALFSVHKNISYLDARTLSFLGIGPRGRKVSQAKLQKMTAPTPEMETDA